MYAGLAEVNRLSACTLCAVSCVSGNDLHTQMHSFVGLVGGIGLDLDFLGDGTLFGVVLGRICSVFSIFSIEEKEQVSLTRKGSPFFFNNW